MTINKPIVIHLVPNAHIDPVWLWDWREGLNQGIATCRAVLDLMDEIPELTFIRGEAAVYAHIEKYDPACFRRIRRRVKEGRWDVVGGTFVQPDTNLPATETFLRQFLRGVRYFKKAFGVRVRVGWSADSFGHAAGLPDILASAGIESYAFSRPLFSQLRIAKPAFWWQGVGGARVLAYCPPVGWYGSERDEMPRRLDQVLRHAASCDLRNIGCFYGLGDHGGGPSRRQVEDIRRWTAAHSEVHLVHSTLHGLFNALRREAAGKDKNFLPLHKGEINFCNRGCYASLAKFKFAYRKAEAELIRAEVADTAISAAMRKDPADLRTAWDGLLFNSFHDILPGSSIERTYDDQLAWIGHVRHTAALVETESLNRLAARIDTSVKPVKGDFPTAVSLLVWNPQARPYQGYVELAQNLDDRPIPAYTGRVQKLPLEVRGPDGNKIPFQVIQSEHTALPELAWRKRVVVPVKLPALGWGVYTMAYVEGAKAPAQAPHLPARTIRNAFLDVKAGSGGNCIMVRDGKGREVTRITAATVEDPWGSWGGMKEEPESCDLSKVRHTWRISSVKTLESGPDLFVLGVKLAGGNSRMELRLRLWRDSKALQVSARVLWNERAARLKLIFSGAGDTAEYQIPGGTVVRPSCGEVPGGRWVRSGKIGFASDALYGFNLRNRKLQATVCRASRYANDSRVAPDDMSWLPAVDRGELKFNFLLTTELDKVSRLAAELERPTVVLPVPASPGTLPRKGSLLCLQPVSLELLALKPAEDSGGIIVRAQAKAACRGSLKWLGRRINLGHVRKGAIATWLIARNGKVTCVNAVEEQ